MLKLKEVKRVLKERWVYYLVGYIIGYLISFLNTGVPSPIYLIPIKLLAFMMALGIGTAIYYGLHGVSTLETPVRAMKYVGFIFLLVVIFKCLYEFFALFGVDISCFSGFPPIK